MTKAEEQALHWRRIHAALDSREDPLADPELAEALSASPEMAAQVVQLLEGLEGLASAASELPVASTGRPRALRKLALLSCAAALVLIGWGTWRGTEHRALEPKLLSKSNSAGKVEALSPSEPRFCVTLESMSIEGYRLSIRTNDLLISKFHPTPANDSFSEEAGLGDGLRPSPGDVLIYERFTALPNHH